MERTSRPTMEIGSIQKDAGVFDQARRTFAFFVGGDNPVLGLGLELPLVVSKPLGGLLHPLDVLSVHEMSAVTAAPLDQLLRRAGQHTLATTTKNAVPATFEEGDVKNVGLLEFLVIETHPFVGVVGY